MFIGIKSERKLNANTPMPCNLDPTSRNFARSDHFENDVIWVILRVNFEMCCDISAVCNIMDMTRVNY